MVTNANTVQKVSTTHFSKFLTASSIHLLTYSDLTIGSLSPELYAADFQQVGLLPTNIKGLKKDVLGLALRSIWLRLFFHPNEVLCRHVNSHLENLHKRYLIGLQIRLGGALANYREKLLMDSKGLYKAIIAVKRHMQEKGLSEKDVFIFVSTDSDLAVKRVRANFGPDCVYTVNEYGIYHSAAASIEGNKKRWMDGIKRAILDLMILKDSDYLVYSRKSSFGKFAHELQHARTSPIHVLPFLKRQGLQCSVYQYSQVVFNSTSI